MCDIQDGNATYPIPPLLVRIRLCAQLLDAQEQADAVADLVDAHLLEHLLVDLEQVLAIDVVLAEDLLVLAALDAAQVLAHALLVPVLDRVGPVEVVELGLGRAGVVLRGHGRGGCPSDGRVCVLWCRSDDARGLRPERRRKRLGCQHCHGVRVMSSIAWGTLQM